MRYGLVSRDRNILGWRISSQYFYQTFIFKQIKFVFISIQDNKKLNYIRKDDQDNFVEQKDLCRMNIILQTLSNSKKNKDNITKRQRKYIYKKTKKKLKKKK